MKVSDPSCKSPLKPRGFWTYDHGKMVCRKSNVMTDMEFVGKLLSIVHRIHKLCSLGLSAIALPSRGDLSGNFLA